MAEILHYAKLGLKRVGKIFKFSPRFYRSDLVHVTICLLDRYHVYSNTEPSSDCGC